MTNWYLYGIRENGPDTPYRYVGYTTDTVERRLALHLFEARKGIKPYALYHWMRSKNFNVVSDTIETLVAGDKELLYTRERFWIAYYRNLQGTLTDRKTEHYLLNITDGGGGALGYKHTPEECERRTKQVGYWSGITGENHPLFGRKMPEDQREALAIRNKENAKRGSDHHRFGVKASEETRRKQSEAKLGTKASEVSKLRMSITRLKNGFDTHSKSHEEYKKYCRWCRGADLQTEVEKKEKELSVKLEEPIIRS